MINIMTLVMLCIYKSPPVLNDTRQYLYCPIVNEITQFLKKYYNRLDKSIFLFFISIYPEL